MINKLTIENLKCFGEKTEIGLAPLTLLYGENSSGKSTVIQALSVLAHGFSPRIPSTTGLALTNKEVPFEDIVHHRDTKRVLTIGAVMELFTEEEILMSGLEIGFKSTAQASSACCNRKFAGHSLPGADDYNVDGSLKLSVTWDNVFAADESGHLVAAVKWPRDLPGRLAAFFSTRWEHVLEGIDRMIEVDVMNAYIASSDTTRAAFRDAASSTLQQEDVGKFKFTKSKAMADALAEMPSWVEACPPDWARYRKTLEYKRSVQHLRQTKYASVLAFYSKPFAQESFLAYLAHNGSKLTLTASPLAIADFTLSPIIANDLLLALNPIAVLDMQDSCGEATGVELCPGQISAFELNILWPGSKGVLACKDRKTETVVDAFNFYSTLRSGIENEARSSYQRSLQSANSDTAGMLFIGPLRDIPKRIYADTTQAKWNGNYNAGEIVPSLLAQDEELLAKVNRWLMRLGVDYEVEVLRAGIPGYFFLRLRDTRSSDPHAACFTDVGFGISQILPILVAGLSGKNAIIMIEQPELHIHPRLQAEIGSFFAECIKERGHQFIIETHSEHLLLRIMKLMRQTYENSLPERVEPLAPADVKILYVERETIGSIVREMPLNARGELVKAWPGGFFEEGLREVF